MTFLWNFLKDLLKDFAFWILLPMALIAVGAVFYGLGVTSEIGLFALLGMGLIVVGVIWLALVWIANTWN